MPDKIYSVPMLLWLDNRQIGNIHLLQHTQASNRICC